MSRFQLQLRLELSFYYFLAEGIILFRRKIINDLESSGKQNKTKKETNISKLVSKGFKGLFFALFIFLIFLYIALIIGYADFGVRNSLNTSGQIGDVSNPVLTFAMVIILLWQIRDQREQHQQLMDEQETLRKQQVKTLKDEIKVNYFTQMVYDIAKSTETMQVTEYVIPLGSSVPIAQTYIGYDLLHSQKQGDTTEYVNQQLDIHKERIQCEIQYVADIIDNEKDKEIQKFYAQVYYRKLGYLFDQGFLTNMCCNIQKSNVLPNK